jgi:hypothetical protein
VQATGTKNGASSGTTIVVDRADITTSSGSATSTPVPTATRTTTPVPTSTPLPTATKAPAPTNTPTPVATSGTTTSRALYINGIASGFTDGSFGYSSKKACDTALYASPACSYAIAYTAWGGVDFQVSSGSISTSGYTKLKYKLYPNGYPITDFGALLTNGTENVIKEVALSSSMVTSLGNGWYQVSVPLSQLNPSNVSISSIQLKNELNASLNTVHYDDVALS